MGFIERFIRRREKKKPELSSEVKTRAKEAARDLVNSLRAQGVEVHWVRLFGSHDRGTARPDSDIDLAVAIEPCLLLEMIKFGVVYDSLKKFGRGVDITIGTPDEWQQNRELYRTVKRGRVLYDEKKTRRA